MISRRVVVKSLRSLIKELKNLKEMYILYKDDYEINVKIDSKIYTLEEAMKYYEERIKYYNFYMY